MINELLVEGMADHTCGIFLVGPDNKFLAVHATGNPPNKRWSLPKGHPNKDEDYEKAAIRELKEETNITLSMFRGKMHYIGESKYNKKNKILHAYAFISEDELPPIDKMECNSKVKAGYPEVDAYKWIDINTNGFIHESADKLLPKVRKLI